MLRTTLRGLLAHKLRLSLAGFAVILGVAFISGTYVLGDTINSIFDQLFQTTTAGIDAEVLAASTGKVQGQTIHPPFPASVVATVQGVDGVKEADGWLQRFAPIIGKDGKVVSAGGAPTFAFLWDPYPDLNPATLRSGSAPQGAGQVVIDAHTAAKEGFRVGDKVSIIMPVGGQKSFTISGLAGFGNQDNLLGATVALFDHDAGPALLGAPGEFDGIHVQAQPGVDAQTLVARINQVLPAGIGAEAGTAYRQSQTDQAHQNIGFLTTFLLIFGYIALFVGAFIIVNTFAILIGQRTRELALLRCLGASRAQVMGSVLLESAVTGVVASAIGLGVGVVIAKGLEALLGAVGLDLSGASLQFQARTAIVGMLDGTLVTIAASVFPAVRATRVAPVEALRDAEPTSAGISRERMGIGGGILAVGVAGIVLGLFVLPSNQLLVVGLGMLSTFVGVAVLAPIVVRPVVSTLGVPVRRLRGVPGELATDNAQRQSRRTAFTASALMIGVGLVACMTVLAASLTDSLDSILDRSVNADYIVSPVSAASQGMSADVATAIAADPRVAVTSPITVAAFSTGGDDLQAEGIDPATVLSVADLTIQKGAPITALTDGGVAISEDAAKNRNLGVGDTLPMQFERAGVHRQRIVSVYGRSPLFGDYLLTRPFTQQTGVQTLDVVVLVKGRAGVSQADLRAALDADTKAFPNTQVQNNQEYKDSQAGNINVLLNLLTTLVFLAIVIALLGVVNTMALSILERVRELGLVRALGMTKGQVRSMVRWETVLITIFGTVLGIVVGLCFGVALVKAFASQGVDVLNLAVERQVLYLVIAFVLGLVAAIFPTIRASRVDMLQAIVTE